MKDIHAFTPMESAALCTLLNRHLQFAVTNGAINKHIGQDYAPGNWPHLLHNTAQNQLVCVKSAYTIWLAMYAQDRHDVLRRFQCLIKNHLHTYPIQNKTMLFCAVFIHELAPLLTQATAYPD